MQVLGSNAEESQVFHLVGLDPGEARCGVAVADASDSIAFPLAVIDTQPIESLAERLLDALGQRGIRSVIIGLPVDQSGGEGAAAGSARTIGEHLARKLDSPVVYIDERFSTRYAAARQKDMGLHGKKSRQQVDAWAAAAILQTYLDSQSQGSTTST
jgi:putative Holliday junction resolvase